MAVLRKLSLLHRVTGSSLLLAMWSSPDEGRSPGGGETYPFPLSVNMPVTTCKDISSTNRSWPEEKGFCWAKERKKKNSQMLKQWNTGNTEEGVCMDEKKEPQPCRLAHSIEEILRRPTVQRSWSVIKENSRLSQSLTCAGKLFPFKTTIKKKRQISKKRLPDVHK